MARSGHWASEIALVSGEMPEGSVDSAKIGRGSLVSGCTHHDLDLCVSEEPIDYVLAGRPQPSFEHTFDSEGSLGYNERYGNRL